MQGSAATFPFDARSLYFRDMRPTSVCKTHNAHMMVQQQQRWCPWELTHCAQCSTSGCVKFLSFLLSCPPPAAPVNSPPPSTSTPPPSFCAPHRAHWCEVGRPAPPLRSAGSPTPMSLRSTYSPLSGPSCLAHCVWSYYTPVKL